MIFYVKSRRIWNFQSWSTRQKYDFHQGFRCISNGRSLHTIDFSRLWKLRVGSRIDIIMSLKMWKLWLGWKQ